MHFNFHLYNTNYRTYKCTDLNFISQMDQELYTVDNLANITVYDEIHEHVSTKYDLFFNEISHEYLIRIKKQHKWHELNINSLTIELTKAGIRVRVSVLETYLNSHLIQKINPFKQYFKELKKWDGKDHIKELTSYIPTDNDALFEYHFKKWLVRTVKCAIDHKYFNKNCIVFAQEKQNSGKTSFCRFICPDKLQNYIAENIGYDKDGMVQLCKNIIINLDEIDKIDQKSINAYKSFFSKTAINVRLPYAKKNSIIPRICSFIGSTNIINFLKDETGNVRWICFEIIGNIDFNYSKNIDINNVWAQAYHLAYSDKKYSAELTHDDILENEKRNEKYRRISIEEDLINELFEQSISRTDFLTSTEVTSYVKKTYSYANHIIIGKALNKLGFKRINNPTTGNKGYMIKRRKK